MRDALPRIYLCHPLKGDIAGNIARVRDIARRITLEEGVLVLAPHVYFPTFLDDLIPEERRLAISLCLELVALASEVRVYGRRRGDETEGMRAEIALALSLGIRVRWMEDEDEKGREGNADREGEGQGRDETQGETGPAPD